MFDGEGTFTDKVEQAGSIKTVVVVFNRLLESPEMETFANYVETDVRFVFVAESMAAVECFPVELRARLVYQRIDFPMFRFDALPSMVHDVVAERVPGATAHASVIEIVLQRARQVTEPDLMRRLRESVDRWAETRAADNLLMRRTDLIGDLDVFNPAHCVAGLQRPRRRLPPGD